MLLYAGIQNGWDFFESYINGLTIAGFLMIFFGGLVLVSGFGTFYIFSYYPRRHKKENGYKETYSEYSERRKSGEKITRENSIAYFIVGLVDLLASLIALLCC